MWNIKGLAYASICLIFFCTRMQILQAMNLFNNNRFGARSDRILFLIQNYSSNNRISSSDSDRLTFRPYGTNCLRDILCETRGTPSGQSILSDC
jgi:hypothetical protein